MSHIRYSDEVKHQAETRRDKTTFVPVHLIDAKSGLVIVTPNGFTLRLPDVSPKNIVERLTALDSC